MGEHERERERERLGRTPRIQHTPKKAQTSAHGSAAWHRALPLPLPLPLLASLASLLALRLCFTWANYVFAWPCRFAPPDPPARPLSVRVELSKVKPRHPPHPPSANLQHPPIVYLGRPPTLANSTSLANFTPQPSLITHCCRFTSQQTSNLPPAHARESHPRPCVLQPHIERKTPPQLMQQEVHGRRPFYYTPLKRAIRAVKWR